MKTMSFTNEFLITGPAKKIVQIYTGRESGCRCGCRGRYFSPGERGYTRALNKLRNLNPTVFMFDGSPDGLAEIDKWMAEHRDYQEIEGTCIGVDTWTSPSGRVIDGWIDLVLPNDRTITIYFSPANY